MNSKEDNGLQVFTTVLAYTLPVLQFFFAQLSGEIQGLFLFKAYFFIVSVFTAIVSYVMILVLRSTAWFNMAPFQWKRKKRVRDWQTFTNPSIYTFDEIKEYQAKNKQPAPLWTIKPDNIIITVFLPLLLVSFIVFIALGLKYGGKGVYIIHSTNDVIKVAIQAFNYAAFLVFAVLSFAHQYIRDSGRKRWQKQKSNKYEKAIELARQRDAFKELKSISLISQKPADLNDPNSLLLFHVRVNDKYFVILTDNEVDTIILVKEYDDADAAEAAVWGNASQQTAESNGGQEHE